MRYVLIFLLLAGCSSEPLLDDQQGRPTDAEAIYKAESLCMKNKDYKNASEYNACVDKALGSNQSAKDKVAERTARAKNGSSTDGLSDIDRVCERYGHALGSSEYDACIEYAKENQGNIGEVSKH